MDGVLCNFDEGCELLPNGIHDYPCAGHNWWANLEWMPHGKLIWKAAHLLFQNVNILSSRGVPNEYERIAKEIDAGKRAWVKKNLKPSLPDNKIYTTESSYRKVDFVDENAILVDDTEDTINDWIEAGGIGILHNDDYYRGTILELIRRARKPIKLSDLVKRPTP
jgi:hypothetical protein